MAIVDFYDPIIIKDPRTRFIPQTASYAPKGMGRRDVLDINDPRNGGDYAVYAHFKIIEQDFTKGFYCFRTSGTSTCLSLYSMVQGLYHLTSFGRGVEISEDFDDITLDQVLRLPMDFDLASEYINKNLIGKTLRVIARSAPKTTPYQTRYYIFAIED